MNIICAEKEGNDVVFMQQRNAFMNLDSTDLTKNMLDTTKVLYIEDENGIALLGEDAFKFATIFEKETRRPMSQGIISPKEKEAIPIMKLIIEKVLGDPKGKNEVLYISTPADPVDTDMNVLYHKKTMEALARGLKYETHVIDEGLAVIYSELSDHNFTGIGISVGAGLTNVTLAYLGTPLMSFSISRGGDWIDKEVAKSTGLPTEHVTHTKETVSKLSKQVKVGSPEGALAIYYEALITYVIQHLNKRLAKITPPKVAFPVVVAGGSALPEGFFEIFETKLRESKLLVEISTIKRAKDPLYAVARGCLIAATTQEKEKKSKTDNKEVTTENTTEETSVETEK
jgi:actin-like ATPase involved in cell morphogenesis